MCDAVPWSSEDKMVENCGWKRLGRSVKTKIYARIKVRQCSKKCSMPGLIYLHKRFRDSFRADVEYMCRQLGRNSAESAF